MVFKRIRLKNFRQYKKEIEFTFSIPDKGSQNITLFIAANGVGKTTLLQAVRYCFYGSSMYLNLPDSKELLNNQLIDDLDELDETTLFVEVEFEHQGIIYVARREKSFKKNNDRMISIGKEGFELSFLSDPKEGYKTVASATKVAEDAAMDKLRAILPEGLSQVFMFDGERMEKNISDKDFSKDLQTSVLGILGITKYEKLIQVLGSTGKSSSVLGFLNAKRQTRTAEEAANVRLYQDFLENLEKEKTELQEIEDEIESINYKIDLTKDEQKKYEALKDLTHERNEKQSKVDYIEEKIQQISTNYIQRSQKAIIYKVLLKNHKSYQAFLSQSDAGTRHFDYLHVKTIEDIQNKGLCVCGRPIVEHTDEYHHLESLKSVALPIENAQYLSMVSEMFNKSTDFAEINSDLKRLRDEKVKSDYEKKLLIKDVNLLNEEISKIEKNLGLTKQEDIDGYYRKKTQLEQQKGQKLLRIRLIKEQIDKKAKLISKIDQNNAYNQKVNEVIGVIETLKNQLVEIKEEKDVVARKTLSRFFDESLSSVMTGDYKVHINEDYKIQITDNTSRKDVTTVLSTGQNVVVSLSFIDALIKTAKEMSESITTNQLYGVFMDAALSNLDETHIDRLCRNNLNQMDQLIFLSFKKQLRDEMYRGIKGHIGKAYHLMKDKNEGVKAIEISAKELDRYIHEIEENNHENV